MPDKFSIPYLNLAGSFPTPALPGGHLTPVVNTVTCCQILNFESCQNLGGNILGPLKLTYAKFFTWLFSWNWVVLAFLIDHFKASIRAEVAFSVSNSDEHNDKEGGSIVVVRSIEKINAVLRKIGFESLVNLLLKRAE